MVVPLATTLKLALLPKGTRGAQVQARLVLRFGDVDGLRGQGMAVAMMGGLIDKGGAGLTRTQISDAFDKLRADVGFGASGQTLTVGITTVRQHLPAVVALVGRLLREPAFPADALDERRRQLLAAVEAQRAKGRKVTASRYIRVAIREAVGSARKPPRLTLHLPNQEPIPGVHFAFVSNASPWTYANSRPVWTNPTTTFETGLGVFATTSMGIWANLRLLRRMLSRTPQIEGPHLIRDDDLPWLRVTSDTPIACQIDGDFVGLRESMTFTSVPAALNVVAPQALAQ